MHIVIDRVQGASLANLSIEAPGHSPNTDGIHIGDSTNVIIEHCVIGTGMDLLYIYIFHPIHYNLFVFFLIIRTALITQLGI